MYTVLGLQLLWRSAMLLIKNEFEFDPCIQKPFIILMF